MQQIFNNNFEIRKLEDSCFKISCKLNDYGLSKTLKNKNGEFKEQISKEAWSKAIEKNKDNIKVFYNHQDIVDVSNNIKFRIENDGVYADVILSDKAEGLYNKIKNNEVSGMSFGMEVIKDNFKHIGNFVKREIEEFNLIEISILDVTPAYNNTYVQTRNLCVPVNLDIYKKKIRII